MKIEYYCLLWSSENVNCQTYCLSEKTHHLDQNIQFLVKIDISTRSYLHSICIVNIEIWVF